MMLYTISICTSFALTCSVHLVKLLTGYVWGLIGYTYSRYCFFMYLFVF